MPQDRRPPLSNAQDLFDPADGARVDVILRDFFERTRDLIAGPGPGRLRDLADGLANLVLRGGKRIRPRLCLSGYRLFTEMQGPPPDPIFRVAAALEIFHAFMLVHDDLIDGSVTRREEPSLHERLSTDESVLARKLGADLALIGGDLLMVLGLRLLATANLDPDRASLVHQQVSDVLLATGVGQALDVSADATPLGQLTESQILDTYERKTGRYTISGPLALGATLGGVPESVRHSLEAMGDRFGVAYQIRNDLEELERPQGSSHGPDLGAGKRTYPLWFAYKAGGPAIRRAIDRALTPMSRHSRSLRLHDLILESGAIGHCRERIAQLEAEGMDVIRSLPLSARQRDGLIQLIEGLRDNAAPLAPRPIPVAPSVFPSVSTYLPALPGGSRPRTVVGPVER